MNSSGMNITSPKGRRNLPRAAKTKMQRLWEHIKDYLFTMDWLMLIVAFVLTGLGFLLIYSSQRFELTESGLNRLMIMQFAAMAMGLVGMFILSLLDYEQLPRYAVWIYILSLISIIATSLFGEGDGNQNWIRIPIGSYNVGIQFSEIVKLCFAITFSVHVYAVKDKLNKIKNFLFLGLHFVVLTAGIILQGDLGQFLVFIFMFISIMFVAGLKIWYFLAMGTGVALISPLIWEHVLKEYHKERIMLIWGGLVDNLGVGYQGFRSMTAISSGQMWGQGVFNGVQAQFSTVPAKHTDFIFAVLGEEFGFVGCMVVFILYIILFARIISVARKSKSELGSYICLGIAAMLMSQTLINIGMCLVLFPVVGITLPFLSYGGSSIMACFLALGLVLSVHRHHKRMLFGENAGHVGTDII